MFHITLRLITINDKFFKKISIHLFTWLCQVLGLLHSSAGKESAFSVGDCGSVPVWNTPWRKDSCTCRTFVVVQGLSSCIGQV